MSDNDLMSEALDTILAMTEPGRVQAMSGTQAAETLARIHALADWRTQRDPLPMSDEQRATYRRQFLQARERERKG